MILIIIEYFLHKVTGLKVNVFIQPELTKHIFCNPKDALAEEVFQIYITEHASSDPQGFVTVQTCTSCMAYRFPDTLLLGSYTVLVSSIQLMEALTLACA